MTHTVKVYTFSPSSLRPLRLVTQQTYVPAPVIYKVAISECRQEFSSELKKKKTFRYLIPYKNYFLNFNLLFFMCSCSLQCTCLFYTCDKMSPYFSGFQLKLATLDACSPRYVANSAYKVMKSSATVKYINCVPNSFPRSSVGDPVLGRLGAGLCYRCSADVSNR